MKISKHFKRSEFACKCKCGFDTVDAQLLNYLEAIRVHFDAPVSINSACRCSEHNAKIGGVDNSQHVQGRAADIVVKGVSPSDVAAFACDLVQHGGVGIYETFTHIDSRGFQARWYG